MRRLLMLILFIAIFCLMAGCSGIRLSGGQAANLNNQISDNLIVMTSPEISDETAASQLVENADYFKRLLEANIFEGVLLNADWHDWLFKITAVCALDAQDATAGKLDRANIVSRLGKYAQAMRILRAGNAGIKATPN